MSIAWCCHQLGCRVSTLESQPSGDQGVIQVLQESDDLREPNNQGGTNQQLKNARHSGLGFTEPNGKQDIDDCSHHQTNCFGQN